ncbi:MAG: tyrosine-type recombinase/integrase, partial [Acidobacteria bacterium]|nr:tyrosine-type recombinase/integrase [Acidobacteriota bacterium]
VYDLRHTHVTHLLYARAPVQSVSKRVGHANPTITMKVYAHVLDEIDQDPLKLVEEYHASGMEWHRSIRCARRAKVAGV